MNITVSTDKSVVSEWKSIARKRGYLLVATHDGHWHADDCLCVAMIKEAISPNEIRVVRSRNPDVIKLADVQVDVGGGEFDHHGTEVKRYRNYVPYASCGKLLDLLESKEMRNIMLSQTLYAVQAIDNGEDPTYMLPVGQRINFFSWVGATNPTYEEKLDPKTIHERFLKVVDMVGIVYSRLKANTRAMITAKAKLDECQRLFDGRIMVLDDPDLPYKYYAKINNIYAVILPSRDEEMWTAKWTNSFSFCASEYPGMTYRHHSGFMANFADKESAISAVIKVIESTWPAE